MYNSCKMNYDITLRYAVSKKNWGELLGKIVHHHSLFHKCRKRPCSAILIGFVGYTVISLFQGASSFHKNNG